MKIIKLIIFTFSLFIIIVLTLNMDFNNNESKIDRFTFFKYAKDNNMETIYKTDDFKNIKGLGNAYCLDNDEVCFYEFTSNEFSKKEFEYKYKTIKKDYDINDLYIYERKRINKIEAEVDSTYILFYRKDNILVTIVTDISNKNKYQDLIKIIN